MRNEYDCIALYTCIHKIKNEDFKTKWEFTYYDSN